MTDIRDCSEAHSAWEATLPVYIGQIPNGKMGTDTKTISLRERVFNH